MTGIRRLKGHAMKGLPLFALLALGVPRAEADCGKWDLSGHWRFVQSNGIVVEFDLKHSGNTIAGSGKYEREAAPRVLVGPLIPTHTFGTSSAGQVAEGLSHGNGFSFSIDWGGSIGKYAGSVDENGFVTGLTYDKKNPNETANWSGDRQAACVVAKAVDPVNPKRLGKLGKRTGVTINPVAPKKLGDPLGPTGLPSTAAVAPNATVTGNVDVYDSPGGEGTVIGMLTQGARVSAECRDDRWCAVTGDVPPNGKGWVWGEFLAF